MASKLLEHQKKLMRLKAAHLQARVRAQEARERIAVIGAQLKSARPARKRGGV